MVSRVLANEIYCGNEKYLPIITEAQYRLAEKIRQRKAQTYSTVLQPFRQDVQCGCCGERLYWRPKTEQWFCRQCGMWTKPIPEKELSDAIAIKLEWIQRHSEVIHPPTTQRNVQSIEGAKLTREIQTDLLETEPNADALIAKILHRAELEYQFCSAGDADPASLQMQKACAEYKPTDDFPHTFYKGIVSNVSLYRDTHIEFKLRNGQIVWGKVMNNMRIVEIPASLRENAGRKNTVRKLRVAAYCRVSTEEEEQQGSFEIQKLYYTEKINSTPEWEVAGIYADDGISGVHTKKRDGFNQMIQDCKKRKIDLILTKSISRFARNTLDSIQYVRMLKQMGIAVVFEKENINTATMNSEMILTVLSAFAQAESESISQNVARGKRMGYKHGKFAFPYGRIIGYRKGADGKPEIIPEQAEIIRLIFNSYLQGDSLQSIKAKLETAGALTARGNTAWSAQSIQRILQNEKYCGDVLLQKTFTEDVLTGVHKKNTGQLPQYYIENYHEGIVSKQMFREVQAEIARRNSKSAANQRKRRRGRYNSKYALSERLFCGDCGSPYKRVTWNIHGRKQIVWRCVNRIEYGTKFCGSSPSIPEEELHRAILKAVQGLAANFTDEVAAQINGILHDIQTGESAKPNLQEQLEQTQQEFDRLLEMSLDFDENTPFLDDKLKNLNSKIKHLKKVIADSAARQEKVGQPEMLLSAKDLQIQEYDDALTARVIEKITVRFRNEIEIRFIGGCQKTMQLK